ncbi:MAG: MFS transporter [Chitinophagaceae bacterium]|nr:MFS transporter [Chitinophagaceae bacterium]
MAFFTNRISTFFQQQTALRYRNYRLFLLGQTFSLIGTWIQRMAMLWLVYRLTNSAFLLGVVGFCEQIPVLFIAPFAGVYADQWDKRKALYRIETLAMIQALLLGLMTLFNFVAVWHLIVLSLLLGVINAFEVPVRQSFVVEMVKRDRLALPNAIALNSTAFNLSRLIGPSIAGILIASVGEGWCFIANAISYAIVVASIIFMKTEKKEWKKTVAKPAIFSQLKEGVRYIALHKIMKTLLIVLAIISFSNAAIRTLSPILAKDILGGNANTLGFLMSAMGVGAITGALFLTKRRANPVLHRIVSFTGILLGLGIIGLGASHWLALSLFFIAISGLAQMTHTATTNTLLQLHVDDDKRGRVMSFYTVCLQGTTPIGSLVAGSLAGYTGGPWALVFMGSICLSGALFFRQKDVLKRLKQVRMQQHDISRYQ